MTDNRREIFCATDTPYRPIRNIKQTTSRDIFGIPKQLKYLKLVVVAQLIGRSLQTPEVRGSIQSWANFIKPAFSQLY